MKTSKMTVMAMGMVLAMGMALSAEAEEKPVKIGVSFGTLQEERWDAERQRMMELDEDEFYRIFATKQCRCPFYRQGDDYTLARRQ